MGYEISTQHYIAAQAHDAYANYIEAAIQGSVVKETDTAYEKCIEEDRKAMAAHRELTRVNEPVLMAYKAVRSELKKEYNSYQKNAHLLLVHLHRVLAMEHAVSMLQNPPPVQTAQPEPVWTT